MNTQKILINIVTTFAVGSMLAPAAVTDYNRAGFTAASAGWSTTTQNFDTLAAGTVLSTLNGVTYSASLGNPVVVNSFDTTSGVNSLGSTSAGYFESTESATFTFATPITVFGIDVNTYGTQAGDYLAATTNLGNVDLSTFDPFPGFTTGQFIGFSSDTPFTSVTIKGIGDTSGNLYSYSLDTMVYGNAASAPEPGTLGALGLGLAAIGLVMRKRHKA